MREVISNTSSFQLAILIKSKSTGLLDRVGPVIERLDALGFHLDERTKRAVLKLAGEMA